MRREDMAVSNTYRWRKVTDINRKYAIFELLANDLLILDIGFSDTGILEIAFNEPIAGFVFGWQRFQELIEEGTRMAELDR